MSIQTSRPCECEVCPVCDGTGICGWNLFDGDEISRHRTDDLQQPIDCDQCRGGIVQVCSYCLDQEDEDICRK